MSDISKMFLNRVKYHAASRLASQTGEGLAQALSVDGHTVSYDKIWSAPTTDFPNQADPTQLNPLTATTDLINVFKTETFTSASGTFNADVQYYTYDQNISSYMLAQGIAGNAIPDGYFTKDNIVSSSLFHGKDNNGKVWTNTKYPAVVLYEDVPMTPVVGSDGADKNGNGRFQAYEILAGNDGITTGSIRIVDWVSPVAVADRTTKAPIAGFSGHVKYGTTRTDIRPLQTVDPTNWGNNSGNWEFVYIAGVLSFHPDYTPQFKDATNGTKYVYLSAFKYVGEYLADKTETIEGDIDTINKQIASLNVAAGADALISCVVPLSGEPVSVVIGTIKDPETGENIQTTTTLSGTISGGVVTALVPYEVITVKEGKEQIYPDVTEIAGIYNIVADYGTADIPSSWSITFRV